MNVENDETVNDIRFLYEILERRGGEQESTAEDGRGAAETSANNAQICGAELMKPQSIMLTHT
ncbi:hypothetical protein [Arcanobacterium hippocoleae]|uniref:hypothetical protein n=1 Tax=Arcanobacterium hippocoleae TaxID=149017 RepID=UPI0033419251